jgi:hypothetical protein
MNNRRYTGTTAEVIDKLAADGYDVEWFGMYRVNKPLEETEISSCGYFTIYYLEGNTAYTVDHQGDKYLDYRALKKSVTTPCWYCGGCKTRFAELGDALAHRDRSDK